VSKNEEKEKEKEERRKKNEKTRVCSFIRFFLFHFQKITFLFRELD